MVKKEKSVLDMVRWMKANPQIYYLRGNDISCRELLQYIQSLEKEGLYESILMLALFGIKDKAIGDAVEQFIYESVIETWERNGSQAMCERFVNILVSEMETAKDRTDNLIGEMKEQRPEAPA